MQLCQWKEIDTLSSKTLYVSNILFVQSEDVPAPLFRSLQLGAPRTDQQQRVLHSLGI